MKKLIDYTIIVTLAMLVNQSSAQSWSAMGSGMTVGNAITTVKPIIGVPGIGLVAGGQFKVADGNPVNYIAKWDGSSWSGFGTGMTNAFSGFNSVDALCYFNSSLYAAGNFGSANGVPASNIAQWTGTTWAALGSGTNSEIDALAEYNGKLYAGGWFSTAGGVSASRIAEWNGSSWASMGTGITNTSIYGSAVFALAAYNGELYAGGPMEFAGGVSVNGIAKWNGTSWSALAPGFINGNAQYNGVLALCVYNNELYVGGRFSVSHGSAANYIAKWNGTNWSTLGNGMNDYVFSLTVYNGVLYAAGAFTTADGIPANHIAKWNGIKWDSVANYSNNYIDGLGTYNGCLYAGGRFTVAPDSAVATRIASYCAAALPPGAGFTSDKTAICASDIIQFTDTSSGNPTSWNWTFPGGIPPTSSKQNPLVLYDTAGTYTVYLKATNGGGSDSISVVSYLSVAPNPATPVVSQSNDTLSCTYDPSYTSYQWYADTAAIQGATNAFLVITQGGNYNIRVGNQYGCFIAAGINVTVGITDYQQELNVSIYPNPAKDKLTVILPPGITSLHIDNILGSKVFHINPLNTSSREIDVDVHGFAKGVYFIHVEDGEKFLTRKLIIE